ncbi:hypothetical protein DWQ65_02245 [Treponema phagedenis]|nr:hypothetical protein DWQ65_02245 [Treponema phagedenis]
MSVFAEQQKPFVYSVFFANDKTLSRAVLVFVNDKIFKAGIAVPLGQPVYFKRASNCSSSFAFRVPPALDPVHKEGKGMLRLFLCQ